MDINKVKQYILDFQEKDLSDVIERDIKLPGSNEIQTVVGARRVGKTYVLFNKIKALLASGVSRKRILYINLETPQLADITHKDFREIVEAHWSIFPETVDEKMYLFIDEPQAIKRWELAVRELDDMKKFKIFITGSSSKLLSKEIATTLRGRSITTILHTLSFNEFLRFKHFDFVLDRLSSSKEAQLIGFLDEYIAYGGYPAVVKVTTEDEKVKLLKEYYDLTIYQDIADRYDIKNTRLIKWLVNALTSSVAKEISINKLYLTLKSQGLRVGKNTLYEYFSMLEDVFFVHPLRKFSHSPKAEGLSMPKIYLNDVGFFSLFSIEDYGKRLENIVFLGLARNSYNNPLLRLHYWKSRTGKEVDFVLTKERNVVQAIQVAYSIAEPDTRVREVKSLVKALKEFGLKEGVIVTMNKEATEKVDKKTINYVPIWKWLLEENT